LHPPATHEDLCRDVELARPQGDRRFRRGEEAIGREQRKHDAERLPAAQLTTVGSD
jgi:hypothetical protein